MIIHELELRNFRNYEKLVLKLPNGITVFYGENAQGKNNILEELSAKSRDGPLNEV